MLGCGLAAEGQFFASNHRCQAGGAKESMSSSFRHAQPPAAKLENLLNSVLEGSAELYPTLVRHPIIIAVHQGSYMGYWGTVGFAAAVPL
jgi:hypothetical protein